jgi:hypothetical protein
MKGGFSRCASAISLRVRETAAKAGNFLASNHSGLLPVTNPARLLPVRVAENGAAPPRGRHDSFQLELQLKELQTNRGDSLAATEPEPQPEPATDTASAVPAATKPGCRSRPEHLPRKRKNHEPAKKTCPDCSAELTKVGEDVSEGLSVIRFKPSRPQNWLRLSPLASNARTICSTSLGVRRGLSTTACSFVMGPLQHRQDALTRMGLL